MNKKAQQQYSVGTIFIGISIFALLLIGGFNFYLGFLVDNNAATPAGIDEASIQASFNRFNSTLASTADDIDANKTKIPVVSGLFDFFASGIDSIKTAWNSIGFMRDYVNFARTNTELDKFLPESWWSIITSLFVIILVLIGIGALWRYQLVK